MNKLKMICISTDGWSEGILTLGKEYQIISGEVDADGTKRRPYFKSDCGKLYMLENQSIVEKHFMDRLEWREMRLNDLGI